jgi:hypothetical protein
MRGRPPSRSRCAAASIEVLEERRLFSWAATIDNSYMPLRPGMTWVYRGMRNGVRETDRTVVLSDTKLITGVTTTVVLDTVYLRGKLAEQTFDWYAQDGAGNVWYFGEDTKEFDAKGNVTSTEGTWQTGVNGAAAGIIMEAHPQRGDVYHQEFAAGVAEDQAKVLSLGARVKSPFGKFHNCLKTSEFTPLQPNAVEQKFYAAGIGFIRSQTVRGSESEVVRLVSVTS